MEFYPTEFARVQDTGKISIMKVINKMHFIS